MRASCLHHYSRARTNPPRPGVRKVVCMDLERSLLGRVRESLGGQEDLHCGQVRESRGGDGLVGLIQCIWSKIGWGQSGCEADKGPA